MKTYKTVQTSIVDSVTCDVCKTTYDYDKDIMEAQEFLTYENDAGYSSIFGDGNRLRVDICQHCVKKLLGPYIRIEGNYMTGETYE